MENDITIIRNMIRDESEAVAHYTDAADKVTNPTVKQILNDIKEEEMVHIGELKQILASIYHIDDRFKEEEGREEASEMIEKADRIRNMCNHIGEIHQRLQI